MSLQANALTSVAALQAYMRTPIQDSDLLAVYVSSGTTATVAVTSTNLTITVNGTPTNFALGTYGTIGALVVAINVAGINALARIVGNTLSDSNYLIALSATDCLLAANEVFLRGIDTASVEQAINAASDIIDRYTGKTFASATYNHRFHGSGWPHLQLKNAPVTQVSRVCIGRRTAISVANSSTTAADATVEVTATSMVHRLIAATTTTQTTTIGTNTMTQLVAAVNALGNGWSASLENSSAASWPGTDLLVQSPISCINGRTVSLHAPELVETAYDLDGPSGTLFRRSGSAVPYAFPQWAWRPPSVWQSHIAGTTPPGAAVWPVGHFNVFVQYTAGYSTVPLDLQMLCNELAANILRSGARDLTLKAESAVGYSWQGNEEGWFTASIKARLGQFRGAVYLPEYVEA